MCYMRQDRKAEEKVGVRELRQNLSVYLSRLKTGTVFRVTERGRAVALLIPIPEHSSAVERLIASGRATAPKHDLLSLPLSKARSGSKDSISRALEEVREDTV
jgi:antitoxin (DNA-binding transcriptional repressor) of toxin-antitoxin stability system